MGRRQSQIDKKATMEKLEEKQTILNYQLIPTSVDV